MEYIVPNPEPLLRNDVTNRRSNYRSWFGRKINISGRKNLQGCAEGSGYTLHYRFGVFVHNECSVWFKSVQLGEGGVRLRGCLGGVQLGRNGGIHAVRLGRGCLGGVQLGRNGGIHAVRLGRGGGIVVQIGWGEGSQRRGHVPCEKGEKDERMIGVVELVVLYDSIAGMIIRNDQEKRLRKRWYK